jgi:N2,N2-dimethylguanosine tRNA methyltransferase
MILVSCRRPLLGAGSSSPCAILRSIARSSCVSADTPQSNVTDARSNPSIANTEYVHIREGKAFMSHAKDKAVFYNKVQTFNRDMSILAVRLFAEVRQKELIEQYHDKLRRYNG